MRLLEMHIECANLETSIELYKNLLEPSKVQWDGPDDPQAFLVFSDGTAFGLWQSGSRGIHDAQGGSHVHFAFQIRPDEYDKFKARIESLNMKALDWTWSDGFRSVYFLDPDGHLGEFMTRGWPG